jgi:hypothetical protein
VGCYRKFAGGFVFEPQIICENLKIYRCGQVKEYYVRKERFSIDIKID